MGAEGAAGIGMGLGIVPGPGIEGARSCWIMASVAGGGAVSCGLAGPSAPDAGTCPKL